MAQAWEASQTELQERPGMAMDQVSTSKWKIMVMNGAGANNGSLIQDGSFRQWRQCLLTEHPVFIPLQNSKHWFLPNVADSMKILLFLLLNGYMAMQLKRILRLQL